MNDTNNDEHLPTKVQQRTEARPAIIKLLEEKKQWMTASHITTVTGIDHKRIFLTLAWMEKKEEILSRDSGIKKPNGRPIKEFMLPAIVTEDELPDPATMDDAAKVNALLGVLEKIASSPNGHSGHMAAMALRAVRWLRSS